MSRYVQGLLLISAVSLAACAPLETRVTEPLENASTRAEHEALANYYELKAKELIRKAEVSRHQARVYGALPYGSQKSTVVTSGQHYNAIAARLEAEAQESLGRVARHRKEAGFAQQ